MSQEDKVPVVDEFRINDDFHWNYVKRIKPNWRFHSLFSRREINARALNDCLPFDDLWVRHVAISIEYKSKFAHDE